MKVNIPRHKNVQSIFLIQYENFSDRGEGEQGEEGGKRKERKIEREGEIRENNDRELIQG